MVEYTSGWFVNSKLQRLYTHNWSPGADSKALVFIVHGMAEHGFCYDTVARSFASEGCMVHGIDLYAHGRSDGEPMKSEFINFVDDVEAYINSVAPNYPGLPYFIVGQSMGGLISCYVVLRDQARWKGMVLTAPCLGIEWSWLDSAKFNVFNTLRKQTGLVSDLKVVPSFHGHELTSDPKEAEKYDSDPLIYHDKVPARIALYTSVAFLELEHDIKWSSFKVPMLVMHGDADTTTSCPHSERFCKTVRSSDVTFHKFPGWKHMVYGEVGSGRSIGMARDWIKARAAPLPAVAAKL